MRPEDLLARLEAGHEYDPMYGQLCNERDQLKAENAKLLEFVADLMAYLKEAERVHSDSLIPDLYYDRARGLGVEVTQ